MPTRSCIMCRRKNEKENLIRIANLDGKVVIDKLQKVNSRGVYFCNNKECISKFINLYNKGKMNLNINLNTEELIQVLNELK